MDSKAIRTYLTLAETLSYQETSRRLNYAPSTLTAHIHALETELGAKLFIKAGRQIEMTAEGMCFREHAQRLLADIDDAKQSVLRQNGSLHMCVGGCELMASYALGPLVSAFLSKYPNIHMSIQFSSNLRTPKMILMDEVDIGFHYTLERRNPPQLDGMFLYREPTCVLAAASHPLARREHLRYADLAHERFTCPHADCYCTTETLQSMRQQGLDAGEASYLGMMPMVLEQVRTTRQLFACPYGASLQICADGSIRRLLLDEEENWLWAGIFYKPTKHLSTAAATLIGFAQRFAQQRILQDPRHFMIK